MGGRVVMVNQDLLEELGALLVPQTAVRVVMEQLQVKGLSETSLEVVVAVQVQ